MDQSVSDQALIKRYLLGDLPDHELEKVEERLMTDREFCEEVSMGRTDLIDEYVAAVLTPQERRRFEDYFLSNAKQFQMVEIARALADRLDIDIKRSDLADQRPKPFYVQHLTLMVTLGAGALLVVGFVTWKVMTLPKPVGGGERMAAQRSILQNELERINPGSVNSGPPTMAVVPLTLRPLLVRDLAENRSVAIPAKPSIIELRLELPNDMYSGYKATLKTDEGIELAVVDKLMSQSPNKAKVLLLNLPSWLMKPGSYEVELSGRLPSNEYEQVGSYPFDIISQK